MAQNPPPKKPQRFGPGFLVAQGAKRGPRGKPAQPPAPGGVVARNPVMPAPAPGAQAAPPMAQRGGVGRAVRGLGNVAQQAGQALQGPPGPPGPPGPRGAAGTGAGGPSRRKQLFQAGAAIANAFPTTDNPAGGGSTVNRHILIGVIVITVAGSLAAIRAHRPVTRVVVGGIVLLIVLSVLDAFGGPLSGVAGGLAMLAMTVVLLMELPDILPSLRAVSDPASLPTGTPPGGGGAHGVK